jgi:hypothetical protein
VQRYSFQLAFCSCQLDFHAVKSHAPNPANHEARSKFIEALQEYYARPANSKKSKMRAVVTNADISALNHIFAAAENKAANEIVAVEKHALSPASDAVDAQMRAHAMRNPNSMCAQLMARWVRMLHTHAARGLSGTWSCVNFHVLMHPRCCMCDAVDAFHRRRRARSWSMLHSSTVRRQR